MKKWLILHKPRTKDLEPRTIEEIINVLLKNRDIKGKQEVEAFLHPTLDQLTIKAAKLDEKELKKAYLRIKKAIENNESIVVYTDYDVDGVCAGAIVWETLYELKAKVMPYIPDRKLEGYGLSKTGIDNVLKEYNASLIIAVDHGVSAEKLIGYAKSKGIDTIILDHHLLPEKLPKSVALIHTTHLCAGGIAWFFGNYLEYRLRHPEESRFNRDEEGSHRDSSPDKIGIRMTLNHLDLAAMATIADLVPLTGLNRIIVKYGLKDLNKTNRVGLSALINEARLSKGEIGVYEVGHMLAPRINAMGRIDHALDALRLICTSDKERAEKLARRLNVVNRERQTLMSESAVFASGLVRSGKLTKLLVVEHESFNEGIIGLVAGKLVEEFSRPVIVISRGEKFSKASARSINGFNIVEVIRQASGLLESIGGHPMAAGFTIATQNINKLKNQLADISENQLKQEMMEKEIKIDTEINFSSITLKLFHDLETLSPFGMGNPQPVFATPNAQITGASLVGRDKQHLKLVLKPPEARDTHTFNAIGFSMGEIYRKLSPGMFIDIAYTIEINNWNGRSSLQLKLKDVKFHE